MNPMPRSRPARIALAAGTAALAAAALYGTLAWRGNSGACAASGPVVARMKPLARGEVAALDVQAVPRPAPALAFTGPDGQPTSLADLRGRTLLVNLWATWCAPCRAEMPALDRLQTALGGPDFAVVALNLDTRNPERPRAWLKENGVTNLAYYADPAGRALPALQREGEVLGLPTSLLVDPSGCAVAVLRGPAEWASEDALRLVRAALGRG